MEALCHRGCVDPNAIKLPTDYEARDTALHVPDFTNEPSEIAMMIKSVSIEVVFEPKGHCDTAVRCINCAWGETKTTFRKKKCYSFQRQLS